MINIISYDRKYKEEVQELLVELQDYHVKLDKQKIMTSASTYKEEYFNLIYQSVQEKEGKIFLVLDKENVVGLAACVVDDLPFGQKYVSSCPKRGRILKLIIKANVRGRKIGTHLLNACESYLHSISCEYIDVDVFGTNQNGFEFYMNHGYHVRTYKIIKKL